MSKSIAKPVSAKVIRTAFQTGALDPAKVVDSKGKPVNPASLFSGPQGRGRGRLNPAFTAAFLAANPGTSYAEGSVAETKMVALPLVSAKTGRPIKPVSVTLTEARALAGVEHKRGRFSSESLAKAAQAYQAK